MCVREIERDREWVSVFLCFVLIYYIIWFIILFAHKSGTPSRGFSNQSIKSLTLFTFFNFSHEIFRIGEKLNFDLKLLLYFLILAKIKNKSRKLRSKFSFILILKISWKKNYNVKALVSFILKYWYLTNLWAGIYQIWCVYPNMGIWLLAQCGP